MRIGADFETLFARMAESAANATLRLDRGSRERLAALEGRSIQVESTEPGQVFSIRISGGRVEVLAGLVDSPDALVRGRLTELMAWFAAPDGSAASRVEIDGAAAVPVALAEVFRGLVPRGLPLPIRGEDLKGAAELAGAVLGSATEGAARAWRQVSGQPFVNRDRFGDAREEIGSLRAEIERLTGRLEALESVGSKAPGAQREPVREDAPARDAGNSRRDEARG